MESSLCLFLSVSSSPQFQNLKQQNIIKLSTPPPPRNKPKSLILGHHRHHCLLPLITLTHPFTLPCVAAVAESPAQQKINLEAIVVSIDEFFNKYPFFVTLVGVVWLVVIPIVEYYLSNYKYTSALDAFQKLRDDPNAALLDIRDDKSLAFLGTPDLSLFKKTAVHQPFSDEEDDHDEFVKKVLSKFKDPANTVVCVIDNFDGSSLKAAELLAKNGFKEAYAVKGGVRGRKGWEAIQEDCFPPSVHVYPRKKGKGSNQKGLNGYVVKKSSEENLGNGSLFTENGSIAEPTSSTSGPGDVSVTNKSDSSGVQTKHGFRPSSPYPNYPDLRPPSSPTPSKPGS